VPGRPALFGTTQQFLDDFGLRSLDDLPALPEIKDLEQLDAALARLAEQATAVGVAEAGDGAEPVDEAATAEAEPAQAEPAAAEAEAESEVIEGGEAVPEEEVEALQGGPVTEANAPLAGDEAPAEGAESSDEESRPE
jgi:segregation and condensation protein B